MLREEKNNRGNPCVDQHARQKIQTRDEKCVFMCINWYEYKRINANTEECT